MEPIIEEASTVAPQLSQTNTIDKATWVQKYWFSPMQMVTVVNPLSYDYPFMVELRHFFIASGSKQKFPGVIANVYLDGMSKIMAQDDENLGMMADPNLKKIYYDKLIVSVDDLVQEHNPLPAYLKNVSPDAQLSPEDVDETPPWERASTVAAPQAPVAPTPVEPPVEPKVVPNRPEKPETKQFDHEGSAYKMVVAKDGREMFYKDGKMTSSAEYAKAASML